MSEYVTIPKRDPQLRSHLNGTFSKTQRALPLKSLNVGSSHITFELVNIELIDRPHLFIVLLKALRWDWLPLTLMPIFFIYCDFWRVEVNYTHIAHVMLSLVCLHFSVFLLNDYSDYMSGANRVEGARVNPVLDSGWLSAVQIYRYALLFLALGGVFGLPILLIRPFVLFPISILAIIGLIGYSLKGVGFKALGLGELVVYSCFGPLLAVGLVFATVGYFSMKHLCLGLFWGGIAATCLSFRQFENLMYDDQVGVQTLVRKLGFDRAKWLLCFQVLMNLVLFFVIHLYFFPYMNFIWSCVFLTGGMGLSFYLVKKIMFIDSSLSSHIKQLRLVSIPMTILYGLMVIISLISV